MNGVVSEIITEWGILGVLIVVFGYLVWENYKAVRDRRNKNNESIKGLENLSKQLSTEMQGLENNILNMGQKIDIVDQKVEHIKENLNERIDIISERINSLPEDSVAASLKQRQDASLEHLKQIEDIMLLGGKMHEIMKEYVEKTNSDHIFIGSFHNGTSNLSGIPYCKFDIISECYCKDKVPHDHEFAPVYKDSDILRYGSLFSTLFNNGQILFHVDPENDKNDMSNYEDIIWRRMSGLGIKQLAVNILKDPDNTASGFLGVVRYDNDVINMNELTNCAKELERIYSINKFKRLEENKN